MREEAPTDVDMTTGPLDEPAQGANAVRPLTRADDPRDAFLYLPKKANPKVTKDPPPLRVVDIWSPICVAHIQEARPL